MPYKLHPPGKRGPCWYVRGTDSDGRFEASTHKESQRDAQRWVEEVYLPDRARRRVPGSGEDVGFKTAAEYYKAASPHLSRADIRKVDAVANEIGDVNCRIVVHATLVAAAEALKPGRANTTKNRHVIAPGAAVLHYAAKNKWCEYQRLSKFKESRKSNRTPAQDEDIALLLANIEKQRTNKRGRKRDVNVAHKRLLLAMLYETGLRLGHLLSLSWDNVDLSSGRVVVRIPKSDETGSVPVSHVVVAMLANMPTKRGRVFPWTTNRGVYGWLKPLTEKLGIVYTPHMSRHKLATDAGAANMPDKSAALLGVWQDARSLHRYQHVRPDAIPGRTVARVLRRK